MPRPQTYSSYYGAHKWLPNDDGFREKRGEHTDADREDGGTENGSPHKEPTYSAAGKSEQDKIHGIGGDGNRDAVACKSLCDEIYHSAKAGHAANDYLFQGR